MFENGNSGPRNFSHTIEASRAMPTVADNTPAVEMPSAFGKLESPYMQKPSQGGGVELSYRSFTKVFVLWRSFHSCQRCLAQINNGKDDEVTLPETGEYTCPHTHNDEYKVAVDNILAGKGLLDTREYFNLHDGTRCVHLSWFEVDAAAARKNEKADKFKKDNAVWPPNVAGAFTDPVAAKKDAAAKATSSSIGEE